MGEINLLIQARVHPSIGRLTDPADAHPLKKSS